MKQRLLTPGPSPVPEETLLELARPVTYHRTAQFRQTLAEVLEDLQYVYCTRNPILPLTASGTGDLCVTGSQKALMLPPGLAFVSVSDKAWQRIDRNPPGRVFYFDLRKYRDKLKDPDTPFTPAHTLVKALRHSLKRIRAEGIE